MNCGKIIVQNIYLDIKGRAEPIFFDKKGTNGLLVPTFGFIEDGRVCTRGNEKERVPPQQEWIEREIESCVSLYRKKQDDPGWWQHGGYYDPPPYKRDELSKDILVYVAVIRRSDRPKEIGLCCSVEKIITDNISISVTEKFSE